MKVFMIGGTGLLGSEAAKQLIKRNHEVISLALPPKPIGADIPKKMKLVLKSYLDMSDSEILELMQGCDAFVFAAGVDERIEGKPPIYEMYHKYNIEPLRRLIPLAKRAKIRKTIVLGSYFCYFNRVWKDLKLYDTHPYIRSRVDQANVALGFANENMVVNVLELPYIFGTQEGRKPVWIFLVEQILKMKMFTFYPRGGTTMITTRQVGELIASVLELENTSKNIPVGYYNFKWKEMLKVFHEGIGIQRGIVSIPKFIYRLGIRSYVYDYKRKGLESGLQFSGLADIMDRNAYINNHDIIQKYKVNKDDIYEAILESVKQSKAFLDGEKNMLEMKAK